MDFYIHSYTPWDQKMCFGGPYKYSHMDRHMDANDTIHSFLSQFCNSHTKKIVQI